MEPMQKIPVFEILHGNFDIESDYYAYSETFKINKNR